VSSACREKASAAAERVLPICNLIAENHSILEPKTIRTVLRLWARMSLD
jgi:hypothetical protein